MLHVLDLSSSQAAIGFEIVRSFLLVSVQATIHFLCRSQYAIFFGYKAVNPRLLSVILLVSVAREAIRYFKACPIASTRSGEEPWPSPHCQW